MNKKILNALRYKDSSKLKKLIRQGYDISNIDLTTILDFKKDIVLLLIEKSKVINIRNEQNHTPLTLAIQKGEYEIVKKLLECGADVNYKAEISGLMGEMTPLRLALLHKDLKITTLLIKHGAEHKESYSEWNAFKKAVLKDDKEVYELLFDCQALQDKNSAIDAAWLPRAVITRSYETVKLLINNNIDINQSFRDGVNGLMLAFNYMLNDEVSPYDQEIVKLLIGAGIDIHKENDKGFTALMIASKDKKAQDAIDILINNGANLDHKNKDGLTALICAVKEKNDVMTKFLIEKGANPEISTKDGITPLMIACWQNDKKIIELLSKENIDIHLKDNEGFSAFDYLTHNNEIDVSLLDILGEKNTHQIMKSKISNIDTNHGINRKNYEQSIKEKTMRHKPKELVEVLNLFTKENPIKYTSHSFEWSEYGSYQNFIDEVKKEFSKIDNELKLLSPNLHTKISNFLFNESLDKDKTWGKYKIAFGWSSPQLKEWCEIEEKKNNAKKAIYFPLPKEHQREIDGKTLTTFDDICTVFKDEIEIRDNDKLNRLFEKIEEEVLGFDFEVEYINLENITFYTDVEYFENAVTKIFEQFKERAEYDSIVVEANNQESYVDIIIEQRGSTVNKSSEEMKKEIDDGDFEDIRQYFFSLCDWSIEAEFLDGNFRVGYLSENQAVNVVELKKKPQGFRHILRFYK